MNLRKNEYVYLQNISILLDFLHSLELIFHSVLPEPVEGCFVHGSTSSPRTESWVVQEVYLTLRHKERNDFLFEIGFKQCG
jgi:hypothetical protein